MSFGNPVFLWALVLLSIPIIIHLFRFRKYKKIVFTQTFFFEQSHAKQKRVKNLKHLLILSARILSILALVIAFSLPFLKGNTNSLSDGRETRNILLFIDNHLGFFFSNEEGLSRMSDVKTSALRLLNGLGDFQKITILTLDRQSEDFFRREDAVRFIQSIQPFAGVEDFSTISKKIEKHIKNEPQPPLIFVISDFLKRADDIAEIKVDFTPLPVKPLNPNELVAIDSVWKEIGAGRFHASPAFLTENKYFSVGLQKRIVFTLRQDNVENENFVFNVPRTNEATYGFIEPENNINQIRRFYFSTAEKERKKILVLANTDNISDALKSKFATMQTVDVEYADARRVDPTLIANYKTIILLHLDDITDRMRIQLSNVLNENGRILLIPSSQADVLSYNRFLQQYDARLQPIKKELIKADKIEYNDLLFKDVFAREIDLPDLPFFNEVYPIEGSGNRPLLYTLSGKTLLGGISTSGGGYLYVLGGPVELSSSNMIFHTIFNPMMFNFLHKYTSYSHLYHLAGRDHLFVFTPENNRKDEPVKVLTPSGDEVIPYQTKKGRDIFVYFGKDVVQNGEFTFTYQGEILDKTVFNFDLKILKNSAYSIEELSAKLSLDLETIRALSDTENRKILLGMNLHELWYFFVILAVLFLVIELLIIRFVS